MKKLMNILFLSCLKATELIEKKLNFKLSFSERIRLNVHKMMCDACRMYEKQSDILDKALNSSLNKDEIVIDLDNYKKEIIANLEEQK